MVRTGDFAEALFGMCASTHLVSLMICFYRYFLINHTKRFIGQRNIEDEIAELEAQAAVSCKAYDEEVAKRDEFNNRIKGQYYGIYIVCFDSR